MKLFGTDGLRGRAGEYPLDPASVRLLGRELGAQAGRCRLGAAPRRRRRRHARVDAARSWRTSPRGCATRAAASPPRGSSRRPGIAELVLEIGAARRRRRLRLPQSLRGQRHQDLRARRPQVAGRGGGVPREEAARGDAARDAPPATPAPPDPDPGLVATYVSRLKASVPEDLDGLPVLLDAGNGAAFQIGPRALPPRGRPRDRDPRRARRPQHQPGLRGASPRRRWPPRRARQAPPSASRSTATPTARSSPTRPAGSSTATTCSGSWRGDWKAPRPAAARAASSAPSCPTSGSRRPSRARASPSRARRGRATATWRA